MSASERSRFDGPVPRLCALGVAALAALALLAIHWDDLFAPEQAAGGLDPDSPVALCIAAEKQTLDKLVAEGAFNEDQAARALAGAEARCFDQHGGNSQVPSQ
ncbi:MAG: hypothetical protein WDZ84_10650 [Rhodovibrionaceae bacterium]